MFGDIEPPANRRISQERFAPQARCARRTPLPGGLFSQPKGGFMPAFTTLPVDPVTGAIGRRASGAPLYHRGSQFGPPERRKLDRNMRVRILHLAIALDRRTKQPRQHGGILKRTGVEVLRILLFTFLNMQTGACFPSHEQISRPAGSRLETAGKAMRALEPAGIISTARRKIVASFTSRQH